MIERVYSVFKQGKLKSCGCMSHPKMIHGHCLGRKNGTNQRSPLYACWLKIRQSKISKPDLWAGYLFFAMVFKDQNLQRGETLARLDKKEPWSADNVYKKLTVVKQPTA